MAYATQRTAHAQKEVAVMQLNEGMLFIQMLTRRVDEAQRKLDMATNQISVMHRLVASTNPSVICQRICEKALLDARIHSWGNEVAAAQTGPSTGTAATTQAGPANPSDIYLDLDLEDNQSVVSYLSEDAEQSSWVDKYVWY